MAETVAVTRRLHCVPRTASSPGPLQPLLSPRPSSQRESCQLGGGLQQSRGGHRCQDGYDLGPGN